MPSSTQPTGKRGPCFFNAKVVYQFQSWGALWNVYILEHADQLYAQEDPSHCFSNNIPSLLERRLQAAVRLRRMIRDLGRIFSFHFSDACKKVSSICLQIFVGCLTSVLMKSLGMMMRTLSQFFQWHEFRMFSRIVILLLLLYHYILLTLHIIMS